MNTGRLRELVETLLQNERRWDGQDKLSDLQAALANLASAPQDPTSQTAVARAIGEFEDVLSDLEAALTPAERVRLAAIGGSPYFTKAAGERLRETLSSNNLTPAVAHEEASTLASERVAFIERLNNIKSTFEELGIDYEELEAGEAEVGFEIPRAIFNNELGDFAKELNQLKFIVRAFSELAGNTGEQIEVRQLSTTDPLILLGVGIFTVRYIGKAVSWALDQWKKIEEIRNIRTLTAGLPKSPGRDRLLKTYDKMVTGNVEGGASAEAKRLTRAAKVKPPRKQELETHLNKALIALMARMERGMTVEIRLGPPTENIEQAEEDEAVKLTSDEVAYQEVAALRQMLVFPAPKGDPMLAITQVDEEANSFPSEKKA